MSNQLAEALRQIADYKQTPCDGDPSVLREYARQALAAYEAAKPAPYGWVLPQGTDDSLFRDHRTVQACTGNAWEGWAPVYLAAPVAVASPLSDEQIDRVTDAQWAINNHKPIYAAHRAYARAIEAAHGIKEMKP